MAGETETIVNLDGFSYRLFKRTEVNLNGPFYRGNVLPFTPTIPGIGSFAPNTREARVTILMHELGHMVRKRDGEWVLPNDGNDIDLSQENTNRIIAACGAEVRSLHRVTFAEEYMATQIPRLEESTAPAS